MTTFNGIAFGFLIGLGIFLAEIMVHALFHRHLLG